MKQPKAKAETQERRLLSTEEAAAYLGLSRSALEKWRKQLGPDGRPKGPDFLNLEGTIRYARQDLDSYLKGCRRKPGENDGFAA